MHAKGWWRGGLASALFFLAGVVRADAPSGGGLPHTFRYASPPGSPIEAVAIAGDFNGWSATADPLIRGSDGVYTATLSFPPGLRHYKLVVGTKWIADPAADPSLAVDDGFGDVLSGITIQPKFIIATAFHYAPPAGAATVPVSVAGDFNGWSAAVNPMVRRADGSYSASISLAPGLHHYKIVYDGKWIPDPAADPSLATDDGFGGKNSGIDSEAPVALPPPAAH